MTYFNWILPALLVGITMPLSSQDCYTIYLIRHAEKQISDENPRDPELTLCGFERAEYIANYLSQINLDVVYSTDYLRTLQTAEPTALSKGMDIKIYDPNELDEFALMLLSEHKNVLVVGHSNTTAVLTGLLTGEENKSLSMSEEEYNRVYQVTICNNKKQLYHFKSAFVCKE